MQTKKKKAFNKIVRELNDKLYYTNYLLLEYNDKHIREKIEEKFNNTLIDSDTSWFIISDQQKLKNVRLLWMI